MTPATAVRAQPAHDPGYTDEEIDRFCLRVATGLLKPGQLDEFCNRIDELISAARAGLTVK